MRITDRLLNLGLAVLWLGGPVLLLMLDHGQVVVGNVR